MPGLPRSRSGFGVFFLIILLFTFWYARLLQPGTLSLHVLSRKLAWIIAGHMMLQSAFTIAVHTRAVASEPIARRFELRASFLLAIAIVFLIGTEGARPGFGRHLLGEDVYRMFMGFYGLIFPAYVWICMIPSRRSPGGATSQKLRGLVIAVAIAGPMFWLGFHHGPDDLVAARDRCRASSAVRQ